MSNSSKYCQFLLHLARLEKSIELRRQNLCEIDAFEPYCAFRILDNDSKNFITTQNIQSFLSYHGLSYDPKIIYSSFIIRYDADKDGYLNYPEFLKSVLPFDDPGLRTLVTQKPVSEKIEDSILEKIVIQALVAFIDEEIRSFMALQEKKSELLIEKDFNFEEIFHEIDSKVVGLVDFKAFFDYFRKNSVFPYDEEIISILHRFDGDGDGRLCIEDMRGFLLISMPIEKKPIRVSEDLSMDHNMIDKIHEAADSVLKSINIAKSSREDMKISEANYDKSNGYGSPAKNSLSRYDYYPYEAVRKFNSPSKMPTSPLKNSQNSFQTPLYETQGISNNFVNDKQREEFLKKMKENPEKVLYRNTVKPDSSALLEIMNKKNKSIANSAELEKVKEIAEIQAIINDVEQRNKFLKEIDEISEKRAENELRIPNSHKNQDSMKKIFIYFIKLLETHTRLAEMKTDLVQKADFNLIDFFGFFDKNKKGFCTLQEFNDELREQDIELDPSLVNLLLKRYDMKNTKKLRFVDFERLVTSHGYKANDRKPINIRGFQFKYKELFSLETRKIISKLISYAVHSEKYLENIRENLENEGFFEELFKEIDKDKDSFISDDELRGFFINYGLKIDLHELETLIRIFDNDRDGKISFLEWKYEYQRKEEKQENHEKIEEKPKILEKIEKKEKIEEKEKIPEKNAKIEKKVKIEEKENGENEKIHEKNVENEKHEENDVKAKELSMSKNNKIDEKHIEKSENDDQAKKLSLSRKSLKEQENAKKQENDENSKIEKTKQSQQSKKSLKEPLLAESQKKRDPIIFPEDSDDENRPSFLEYKIQKIGPSPELKPSSEPIPENKAVIGLEQVKGSNEESDFKAEIEGK